jgi:hypothetical protein
MQGPGKFLLENREEQQRLVASKADKTIHPLLCEFQAKRSEVQHSMVQKQSRVISSSLAYSVFILIHSMLWDEINSRPRP